MQVNCEGCAGCCLDWRPLTSANTDQPSHEHRDPRTPLDDRYNFPTLSADEVRAFVDSGLGDALTVRLFTPAENDDVVSIDGYELAAIQDRPVFLIGLKAAIKPVAPFAETRTWLPTCVFLDPKTLQCRIHDDDLYPKTCSTYPATNLQLERETECERVESKFGGERLRDKTPPETAPNPFRSAALGGTVFAHPDPEDLTGVIDRLVTDRATREDRAQCIGVAAGSRHGTIEIDEKRSHQARQKVVETDSWVATAEDKWSSRADSIGNTVAGDWTDCDETAGGPETPGWEHIE